MRGRWGTQCEVEKFILRAGQEELSEAFKALMPATEAVEEQGAAELELGYIDEDGDSHRKKMSRWRTEAYAGICSTWFWLEVELGLISCTPL